MSARAPKILTPAYYERLDELERRHWWCRSVRRVALAWIGALEPGSAVLDAGCGTGGFLAALRKRGFAGRAIGLDLAAEALARAKKSGGISSLARASVSDLPVAPSSVAVVVLHDVLQHLPDGEDRRALGEAFRVLAPGGSLLLRTNVGAPIGGTAALHRRYDAAGLAALVQSAGFRVEKHRLLHPAMALLGRLRARSEGHASDGESGLSAKIPPGPVNFVLDLASRLSDAAVGALPFRLPAGDVQVLRARKPLPGRRDSR